MKELPGKEYLESVFSYDSNIGVLMWKYRPINHFRNESGYKAYNSMKPGNIAGNVRRNGYKRVKLDGVEYQVHRIIWKMFYGYDPKEFIDHKNGNPSDNRIENLRLSNVITNGYNSKKQINNKTGYKGVSLTQENNYRADIQAGGKHIYLGRYDTPQDAYAAYCDAAIKYHGSFARVS